MKKSIYKPTGIVSMIVDEINIIEDVEPGMTFTAFPVGYPYIEVAVESGIALEKQLGKEEIFSYLCGQFISPFEWRTYSQVNKIVAIQIHPWALSFLFRENLQHFHNSQISLAVVDVNLAKQLEDALCKQLSNDCLFLEIEEIIRKHICYETIDKRVMAAWLHILRNKGNVKISDLAKHVYVSPRRLQQLFKIFFGISPKSYSKIVRTQYYMYQLLTGSIHRKHIPLSYFDQAHFIHELKAQTGMTPSKCSEFFDTSLLKSEYLNWNLFYKYEVDKKNNYTEHIFVESLL